MKYEVRFVNGYWSLFDTDEYASIRLYGLRRDAKAHCDNANLDHLHNQL